MTSTNGANVPEAIRHLRTAGYTVAGLASELSVSVSTVYRWATGRCQPSSGNFTALREWVDMTYARENAKRRLTVVGVHLADAHDALLTDVERAEAEAIAARLAADLAERERRSRAAHHMDRIAATDPFALVGEPREVAMW